ncbi:amino acid synthesis family protein [Nakamurella flava]|uniref:Amino acid synthesis family protein n=1 Tax=Nakamurella flava TaxID=2576308 RepID=A0A4U6QCW1_9ACTN|nr:amino acid synthesis family protein [Nakamurella flava]TKV57759.1 amino acid synthesis family protein [Nakamurella flava]
MTAFALAGDARESAGGSGRAAPQVLAGVRKTVLGVEDVLLENGRGPAVPARRAFAAAVIANPWLGTDPTADLGDEVFAIAPVLARGLTDRLIDALGGPERIEAFGKAAIVGTAGEIEHAGALIHTPYFGNLMRDFLDGDSIICFADARAEAGEALVVPMWHKRHVATRSHYQTVCARVADAPHAGEIVVIAAASTGPRPHARIGDRSTDPVVNAAQHLESDLSW